MPVLVNLFHNGIHFWVVRPTACGATNTCSPFLSRLNDPHLNLDLLVESYAKVFIEFDGPAVDPAV